MAKMTVKYLKQLNSLVIKNEEGRGLFISGPDSLIISIEGLASLLKFLTFNGFLSIKVLEGIVSEYYTHKDSLTYKKDFTEFDNDYFDKNK
jgi:hypothetical protein